MIHSIMSAKQNALSFKSQPPNHGLKTQLKPFRIAWYEEVTGHDRYRFFIYQSKTKNVLEIWSSILTTTVLYLVI